MRRGSRLPPEVLQPFLVDTSAQPIAALTPPPTIASSAAPISDNIEAAKDPPPDAAKPPNAAEPPRIDWAELFGNDHAIEIEVGCGKGMFLLASALARPEINFLGIEIQRKYALYTATRLAKRELGNAKMACADARIFFARRVPAGTVQAVHIFFPDPWWKTRHRKRRLLTAEFIEACSVVLRPGGKIFFVTDVADYFAESDGLFRQQTALRALPPPEVRSPEHDLDYLTNFERKYRKEGRPIHRGLYEKVS